MKTKKRAKTSVRPVRAAKEEAISTAYQKQSFLPKFLSNLWRGRSVR